MSMLHIGDECAFALADVFESGDGLTAKWRELMIDEDGELLAPNGVTVIRGQAPLELLLKSTSIQLPVCHVYCRKMQNDMRGKFNAVSGRAEVVVECTVSGVAVEELTKQTSTAIAAITEMLAAQRGSWLSGAYYDGAWSVDVSPARLGGKQFLQSCRVAVALDVRKA